VADLAAGPHRCHLPTRLDPGHTSYKAMNDMDNPGYEDDLVLWAENQAQALRRAASTASNLSIDWLNVAEEIEALARAERSALASNVTTIIEHLLKLEASPANDPRIGWRETILRARSTIEAILDASPGLRPSLYTVVHAAHPRARKLAQGVLALYGETPTIEIDDITYTADEVLRNWWPPSR